MYRGLLAPAGKETGGESEGQRGVGASPAPQAAPSTHSETHGDTPKDPSVDGTCDGDTDQAEPGVPLTPPSAGISPVLLSPLLSSFHCSCSGLGFCSGISTGNKQSPTVTLWCEMVGDGLGSAGRKACRGWDLGCCGRCGCGLGDSCHSLSSCPAQRLIQPARTPRHCSPSPGACAPRAPSVQDILAPAQPLLILPPKRIWKTSSQLSRFMKA